jgi:hypothetical protein
MGNSMKSTPAPPERPLPSTDGKSTLREPRGRTRQWWTLIIKKPESWASGVHELVFLILSVVQMFHN